MAMRDVCSIAKEDEWDKAIEAYYRLNYWPYVNAKSETATCLAEMFKDSP